MSLDQVFSGFGCTGKNISPELEWKNVPENQKLCCYSLWSWRSHRKRMVALDNFQYTCKNRKIRWKRWRSGFRHCSWRQHPEHDRLRKTGIWRSMPSRRRQASQIHLYCPCTWYRQTSLDQNVTGAMAGFNLNQHTISRAQLTVLFFKIETFAGSFLSMRYERNEPESLLSYRKIMPCDHYISGIFNPVHLWLPYYSLRDL